MHYEDFLFRLSETLNSHLPLALYRKPNSNTLEAFIQEDTALHYTTTFNEKGFAFAPFIYKGEAVLIKGDYLTAPCSFNNKTETVYKQNPILESTKQEYLKTLSSVIKNIKVSPSLKKVVLSRKQTLEIKDQDVIDLFLRLEANYKSACVYLFYHPSIGTWLGATPETLISQKGSSFKTMALAGTQPDGAQIHWREKEIEEQHIVVDEIISRLDQLPDIHYKVGARINHKAGSVVHLKTELSGRLPEAIGLKQLIDVLHPTSAVCGLPREEALKVIDASETYARTYYTGFLGPINTTITQSRNSNKNNVENSAYYAIRKQSDIFVNLRCMQINKESISLYVGGGITALSNPEEEWQETVNKAQTMLQVITSH